MRIIRLSAAIATFTALGSLASAQFTSIGAFSGNAGTEGFDYQVTPTAFPTCVEDRVFYDTADLCGLNGGFAHITGSWGFGCTIFPNNSPRLFGGSNHVMYTFDDTVTKFGGYFGTNNPSAGDGNINFYDAAGNLLYSDTITAPNDCTWTWNGWDSGGIPVKSIECWSNYSSGGYLNMDDMEAEIGGGGVGTAYCFGDVGSGTPCPCGNDNDGSVPESGCANGVFASGAQMTAAGVPSLATDTLVLATTGLEPNNSGLYFQANNDLSPGIVWGDGLQCAGGQLKRLGVRFSDATGYSDTSGYPQSISVKAGNILAGDTKYYQCWYRNPVSSPCSSDFNASNGLAITWAP